MAKKATRPACPPAPGAVKPVETTRRRFVCISASGFGSLIQAAVGSFGGTGGLAKPQLLATAPNEVWSWERVRFSHDLQRRLGAAQLGGQASVLAAQSLDLGRLGALLRLATLGGQGVEGADIPGAARLHDVGGDPQ
jgi:hypothetical protein